MRRNLPHLISCKNSRLCCVVLLVVQKNKKTSHIGCHASLTTYFFVSAKHVACAKHEVLNLMKNKHRAPETRLNPCLIFPSRLEQMNIELMDDRMDAHGGAGGR